MIFQKGKKNRSFVKVRSINTFYSCLSLSGQNRIDFWLDCQKCPSWLQLLSRGCKISTLTLWKRFDWAGSLSVCVSLCVCVSVCVFVMGQLACVFQAHNGSRVWDCSDCMTVTLMHVPWSLIDIDTHILTPQVCDVWSKQLHAWESSPSSTITHTHINKTMFCYPQSTRLRTSQPSKLGVCK